MALEPFQKVQIRLGGCVAAKPKQGDCRDLEIPASECMYTLLWMYSVFSLLVIQSLVHTQTWSLHRPWVSSQTVKCSVSVPSHGVPSALGFVMTCTDISAMLDLCAEQARMPSRSTNTFPRYPGTERCESLKVCYFVYIYIYIWTIYHKLKSCKQLLQSQFSSPLALTKCCTQLNLVFFAQV